MRVYCKRYRTQLGKLENSMKLVANSKSLIQVLNKNIKQQGKALKSKALLAAASTRKGTGARSSRKPKAKAKATAKNAAKPNVRIWTGRSAPPEPVDEEEECQEGGEEESDFEEDETISDWSSIQEYSVPSWNPRKRNGKGSMFFSSLQGFGGLYG